MNVLLLGSGGREHALAWKLAQSPLLSSLYIAPGNAGTLDYGENLAIDITDFSQIKTACLDLAINMVIVGPEEPLVKGLQNFFKADPALSPILFIGPSQQGALLEGSKDFAKEFMAKYEIPTPAYKTFTSHNIGEAPAFLNKIGAPYVLKADGLAAGKGVIILEDKQQALQELDAMIHGKKFGEASTKVVIEEFKNGTELSVFVLTDGQSYKILPAARDYKRVGDGNTGLNTGGMGAISPVPEIDKDFLQRIEDRIIRITVNALHQEGISYQGFLFFGIMKCNNNPYVIEYNCRLGDPETEVIMPRLKNDLIELLVAVHQQTLSDEIIVEDKRSAATVVMVSGGYPGPYQKGKVITGADQIKESLVFHAGTAEHNESIITSGGRVMAITSLGENIQEAAAKTYAALTDVAFEGMYYRKDIGS
ncbi:MAG: hypothetical protein RIQ89_647 [Bacteroidota bacterium]|jgi:phosphoribosylamine---glycine ligase